VYVVLTRVKTTADQPVETATIVAEEMERWFRDIDGFEGMLMLSREGSTVGVTFWESRDVADRHRVARLEFLERMTSIAGVEVEESIDYDLMFSALADRVRSFPG
jgi:hypothetical protein